MAKFKVGDKVIRTGTTTETVIRGKIYTVSSTTFSNINGNIFSIVGDSKYSYTEDGFDLVSSSSLPTDRPLTYDETQMLKKGDVVFTCTERIIKSINEKEIRFTNSERNVWILDPENKKTKGNLFFVSHGKEESKEEKKEKVKSEIEDFYTPKHFNCKTQSVWEYPRPVKLQGALAIKESTKETVSKSVSQILYGRR